VISILPESFDDALKCLMIFVVGGLLSWGIGQRLKLGPTISLLLYVWHTVFSFVYISVLLSRSGDAIGYFMRSFDRFLAFDLGTAAVVSATSFLTTGMQLSFLACNLVYNFFGAAGLLFLAAALRGQAGTWKWQHWAIMLLPSVSFWTSSIGKDAISFFAICIFAWGITLDRTKLWPVVLSVILMGLVRPHIAVILAGTVMGASILNVRQAPVRGMLAAIIGIVGAAFLVPIVMQSMSLETLGLDELGTVIEGRENANTQGGSSIDIRTLSFPLKLFSYMFRPLPNEASDIIQLINSFENVFLLFIFIAGLYSLIVRFNGRSFLASLPLLVLGVATLVLLALTTANMGIAVRQKWMALVPLLVFICVCLETKLPALRQRVRKAQRYTTAPGAQGYRPPQRWP
jgi:hypothetical protein